MIDKIRYLLTVFVGLRAASQASASSDKIETQRGSSFVQCSLSYICNALLNLLIMANVTLSHLPKLLDSRSWYPSQYRDIVRQPWFLPLILSSFIFSSLFSRKARIWVATPALILLLSQIRTYSTGDVKGDFGRAAFVFGFVLKWIDFGMLIKDGTIWKVKKKGGLRRGKKGGLYETEKKENEGLWQRFKDSLDIWIFNMRGINWSWRVNGIPDRAPQSKSCVLPFQHISLSITFLNLIPRQILPLPHQSPNPGFLSRF
jgi:hypothetical protein